MPDDTSSPRFVLASTIAGMAAGLYPNLSVEDRRERVIASLGLLPSAAWVDGRLGYLVAPREAL